MASKIRWTFEAIHDLDSIVKYRDAEWSERVRILEDEAIKLTLAGLNDHPMQKKYEENVKAILRNYIRQAEEIELIQKYKRNMPR